MRKTKVYDRQEGQPLSSCYTLYPYLIVYVSHQWWVLAWHYSIIHFSVLFFSSWKYMTTFFASVFENVWVNLIYKKNQDNLIHTHMCLYFTFLFFLNVYDHFFSFSFLRLYEFNKMNQDNLTLSTLIICFSQKRKKI
jgi:hypothetical protein